MASLHLRPKHTSTVTRPVPKPYVDINEDTGELDRRMPNSKLAIEELMKDLEVGPYQYSPVEQVFMGVLPTYNPSSSALSSSVYDEASHLHYTCKDCGDKFLIESSLRLHKARTTVSIEYNCLECQRGLTFYNRCNFLSHLRQHNFDPSEKDFGSVDFTLSPLPPDKLGGVQVPKPAADWPAEMTKGRSDDEQNSNCSSSSSGFASECRSVSSADVGTASTVVTTPTYLRPPPAYVSPPRAHVNPPPPYVSPPPARRPTRTCPECNIELSSSLPEHYWGDDQQTSPRYECKQCSLVLNTKCCLNAHVRIHNRQKPFVCPECCIVFMDWQPFWNHVTKICFHFNRVVSYSCHVCQFLCETTAVLHKHISVFHTESDVYLCERCNSNNDYFCSGFPDRNTLKTHFAKSHKIRNPKRNGLLMEPSKCCQVCGETVLKRKYIAHVLKHCNSSRCYAYGCPKCKGLYKSKFTYERHRDRGCMRSKAQQAESKMQVPHKPQHEPSIEPPTECSKDPEVISNIDPVQNAVVEVEATVPSDKVLPKRKRKAKTKVVGDSKKKSNLMPFGLFHCNQCNEVLDLSKETVHGHMYVRHNNLRYLPKPRQYGTLDGTKRNEGGEQGEEKEAGQGEEKEVERSEGEQEVDLEKNEVERSEGEQEVLYGEENVAESEENEGEEEEEVSDEEEEEDEYVVETSRERKPRQRDSSPTFHQRKSKRKAKVMGNDSDDSDYEPPRKVFVPSKKKYISNRRKFKPRLGPSSARYALQKRTWKQTLKSKAEAKPSNEKVEVRVKRKPGPKKKVKAQETSGPFACLKCPFSVESAAAFKEHVKEHRTPNDFQCMECGMCFVTKPSFNIHLIMIHKIKDVEAYIASNDCCDLEVVQKEIETPALGLTVREDEIPTVLSENQCSICRKVCDSALNLSNHFRTHGMAYLLWKKRQGHTVDADSASIEQS